MIVASKLAFSMPGALPCQTLVGGLGVTSPGASPSLDLGDSERPVIY